MSPTFALVLLPLLAVYIGGVQRLTKWTPRGPCGWGDGQPAPAPARRPR